MVPHVSFWFLDELHDKKYPQVGSDSTQSWAVPNIHKKYGDIAYTIALCVEGGYWKLLVFKQDQSTDWMQTLVKDETLKWKCAKGGWLSNNGERTQLFLTMRDAQDGGVATEQALVERSFAMRESKVGMKRSTSPKVKGPAKKHKLEET
jgi:hypothetical protein